ncbi:MAG: tryptophan--tRNA ligase [Bdellovibrionales bacterium]
MNTELDLKNKTVLTGVKPTHNAHIGNYLGAIRPGIELSNQSSKSLLFIADYHALTTVQSGKDMHEYTHSIAATWLACGLNTEKTILYRQSDVPEIFELSWILSCIAPKGLLNRAHAYKARIQENEVAKKEDLDAGVSMGLFCYPVLMAADILLFNTDIVPVGEDQVQHVEIARDLAQKFNRLYGDIFKLPKHIVQIAKNVPGLDGRKMSKSYDNHIPLFLESAKLRKMIMKIVTDSSPPESPKETKGSVLFELYKEFSTPEELKELENKYQVGVGWGVVKQMLFEVIEKHFAQSTVEYNKLMLDRKHLESILTEGALRARTIATPVLESVRKAVRG